MKKYGGKLIHSCKDEFGPIEVVEFYDRMRSLHFGNKTQQTAMFLYDPIILIHKYTQAMLTPLCWQTPERVLILGLGAGSIAKFLLHHYQQLNLSAVDLRPKVVDIGHEYFNLQQENDRFSIHYQTAAEFVNNSTRLNDTFDLILVDLYLTRKNQDITVDISDFIEQIPQLLTNNGNFCINLIGDEPYLYPAFNLIKNAFDELYSVAIDNKNCILIAGSIRFDIAENMSAIDYLALEKRLKIPIRHYLEKMDKL